MLAILLIESVGKRDTQQFKILNQKTINLFFFKVLSNLVHLEGKRGTLKGKIYII